MPRLKDEACCVSAFFEQDQETHQVQAIAFSETNVVTF
jgi:hypothetical protein